MESKISKYLGEAPKRGIVKDFGKLEKMYIRASEDFDARVVTVFLEIAQELKLHKQAKEIEKYAVMFDNAMAALGAAIDKMKRNLE